MCLRNYITKSEDLLTLTTLAIVYILTFMDLIIGAWYSHLVQEYNGTPGIYDFSGHIYTFMDNVDACLVLTSFLCLFGLFYVTCLRIQEGRNKTYIIFTYVITGIMLVLSTCVGLLGYMKYDGLNDDDKKIWNNINSDFVNVLSNGSFWILEVSADLLAWILIVIVLVLCCKEKEEEKTYLLETSQPKPYVNIQESQIV